MRGHVRMMAIVVGVSALTAACSGGSAPSVLGPTSVTAGTARGADDGGGSDGGPAELRVLCEQRSGRSKVSVDAKNLSSGTYQARIASGANSATAAAQATIGDEVEFDFDSDRGNVAAGATSIADAFIQNGSVQGELLNASGTVILTATAGCSVR